MEGEYIWFRNHNLEVGHNSFYLFTYSDVGEPCGGFPHKAPHPPPEHSNSTGEALVTLVTLGSNAILGVKSLPSPRPFSTYSGANSP